MKHLKAIVTVHHDNGHFNECVSREFTLIPPKDEEYYGTGYYMTVRMPGWHKVIDYVDVRYWGSTNAEKLGKMYMLYKFGYESNAYTTIETTFPKEDQIAE